MELEKYELIRLLNDAAELGAKKALMEAGLNITHLTQNHAFKLYGEYRVRRWVKEGLIKPSKDGDNTSTVRYDRLKLEILAKTSNRATYLNSKENVSNIE